LAIDPNPLIGEPAKEYKLTALSKGSAPKSSKFVWDFGDGSSKVTVQNDSTVKHTFAKEGKFNITVEMFDNAANKKITEATGVAEIKKVDETLKTLQKSLYIDIETSFDFVLSSGENYGQGIDFPYNSTIVWNNTDFSASYKSEGTFDATGDKTNYYRTVSGKVSSDARKILTITYEYKAEYYRYKEWFETHTEKMTFTDVPIVYAKGDIEWGWGPVDYFLYELKPTEALSHVSFCEWRWFDKSGYNNILGLSKLKRFWSDSPLQIKFTEKR